MGESFTVDICGRKEVLPVLEISDGIKVCFFNLHGNVALTEHCGKKIAEIIEAYKPDVLITAESKGLQLTHVVARELNHEFYAVARKSKKLYMQDGIQVSVKSITTAAEQCLYLSAHDVDLINGKRVAVIDDVVSTGASVAALESLVINAGGTVVCRTFVLAEGDAKYRTDVKYLATIPLL